MALDKYDFVDSFRHRLETAMEKREISAAELSKRSGLSESLISGYRTGRQEPKREKIALLSKALSVEPTWLMGFDVPMDGETYKESEIIKHMKSRISSLSATSEKQLLDAMEMDVDFWEHIKTLYRMTFSYKKECYKFIDFQKEQEQRTSGEISTSSEAI